VGARHDPADQYFAQLVISSTEWIDMVFKPSSNVCFGRIVVLRSLITQWFAVEELLALRLRQARAILIRWILSPRPVDEDGIQISIQRTNPMRKTEA
jgi:hypothetical protein